jgi:hypothetical protein
MDYALDYVACGTTSEEYSTALISIMILSDASYVPQGFRGHQRMLAMWGNILI